ncbi:putative NUDIX hydrolase [Rubripirellula amarantea]|uniref:Putative NUDIX hydrolase n=1 Tax=Rubripirellula amarantea TaxID=2527999 RepID=A0A5C5WKE9_9BACT|nr:CoA pyrophosphatase [Rubripirellula amarantea]TWT51266.1 putative NUDIX hydrolase [Rubripirellula amarantea]
MDDLAFNESLPNHLPEWLGDDGRSANQPSSPAWPRRSLRFKPTSRVARSRLAPQLAYGRHRGPAPHHVREAAVLVAIYRDSKLGWTIPLTMRPPTLSHHGGQISLPGGRIEKGESVLQAAKREYEEELGLPPEMISICGNLTPQYVYASNHRVSSIVAVIQPPPHPWQPDPAEVADVVLLPLAHLLRRHPLSRKLVSRRIQPVLSNLEDTGAPREFTFFAPAYLISQRSGENAAESPSGVNHEIWGATAIILDELARRIRLGLERMLH